MIEKAIALVSEKKDLSREESKIVFDEIMGGKATHKQIVKFLVALSEKGESIEEIQGACESMRHVVAKVKYNGEENLLDVVGTGGDNKNSFNVSTCSAFVCAGAGCIVAKHGNRSVSSKCGAADVLEKLGVNIETSPERNSEILNKIGLVFMFAQRHHPAMKYAAAPRKEIGKRTIFNILGPITNPANANTFLLGAYSGELAEKLAFVLAGLGIKRALVVHGSGFDEATLTGKTIIFDVFDEKVGKTEITPEQFGFEKCDEKDLAVSDSDESAQIILRILSGKEKGPRLDTVLLNAGLAIYANEKAFTMEEGILLARKSIDSGKALKKLGQLKEAGLE